MSPNGNKEQKKPEPQREAVAKKVCQIAEAALKIKAISAETVLVGPGGAIDSVTIHDFVVRLESHFKVDFTFDIDLDALSTVAAVVDFILQSLKPVKEQAKIFKTIRDRVSMEEGTEVLERLLIEIHVLKNLPVKDLARDCLLPIPLVVAIRNELTKAGILYRSASGFKTTEMGKTIVEDELGYHGIDTLLFKQLLSSSPEITLKQILATLDTLLADRPPVDVTVDQSKCTAETALKRALLALQSFALIGKAVLFVGDDDLISVAAGFLLNKLFSERTHGTTLVVIDIDQRILDYIESTALRFDLPITCQQADLRDPLDKNLRGRFDTFFTDPPYTLEGSLLFVSRALDGLKPEPGRLGFLSFAHKTANFMVQLQKAFSHMGLAQLAISPRYNFYEGASIISNTSQMITLQTTTNTVPFFEGTYVGKIYTGEQRKTVRVYKCKACGEETIVGAEQTIETIEQLKNEGCKSCGKNCFTLQKRRPQGAG